MTEGNVRIGWNQISAMGANGGPAMEVMYYGTGDRFAYFDSHGSDAEPDYSARLIRVAGEHGDFALANKGLGAVMLNAEAGGPVRLATGGASRMRVTADGRVGVGTTAPTTALDVAGPVRAGRMPKAALPPAAEAGRASMGRRHGSDVQRRHGLARGGARGGVGVAGGGTLPVAIILCAEPP